MNFEPQKYFIGIIDFFSILLPGALLTYLFQDDVGPLLLGKCLYCRLDGTKGAIVFLFSCYILGHFLFLVGSTLDYFIYYPIRSRTEDKQIRNLLSGKKLSWPVIRFIVWFVGRLCFKNNPDKALYQVIKLKNKCLNRAGIEANTINAFQWCKLRLAKENPEILEVVNRFETNSKFFRSFLPINFY